MYLKEVMSVELSELEVGKTYSVTSSEESVSRFYVVQPGAQPVVLLSREVQGTGFMTVAAQLFTLAEGLIPFGNFGLGYFDEAGDALFCVWQEIEGSDFKFECLGSEAEFEKS